MTEIYIMNGTKIKSREWEYLDPEYEDPGISDTLITGALVIGAWYRTGSYEGDGTILIKMPNGWYMDGLSHCSCYGPIDDIGDNTVAGNPDGLALDDLNLQGEDLDLANLLKAHGWK